MVARKEGMARRMAFDIAGKSAHESTSSIGERRRSVDLPCRSRSPMAEVRVIGIDTILPTSRRPWSRGVRTRFCAYRAVASLLHAR